MTGTGEQGGVRNFSCQLPVELWDAFDGYARDTKMTKVAVIVRGLLREIGDEHFDDDARRRLADQYGIDAIEEPTT